MSSLPFEGFIIQSTGENLIQSKREKEGRCGGTSRNRAQEIKGQRGRGEDVAMERKEGGQAVCG